MYVRHDLDTDVLAQATISNGLAVAIQGQYQVVCSSTKIHVYAAQITEVVNVVRLDLTRLGVPCLQPGTLWLREDALVTVDKHIFTVDRVSPRRLLLMACVRLLTCRACRIA